MADFNGAKLTTQSIREITEDIKNAYSNVTDIMKEFNNTMDEISGNAEGGIVDKIADTGRDLYDGLISLAECFVDLGIKIGDYLKMMLTHDSEMADRLRERIER